MLFLKILNVFVLFFFAMKIYSANEWIVSRGMSAKGISVVLDEEGSPLYISKVLSPEIVTTEVLSYEIAKFFQLDCVAKVEKDDDNDTIRSYYVNFEAGNPKSKAESLYSFLKKQYHQKSNKERNKAFKDFVKKIDSKNVIQLGVFYFLTQQRDTNFNNILIQHNSDTDKYFFKAIDFMESFYYLFPRESDNPKDFLLELIREKTHEQNVDISIKNDINSLTFTQLFDLIRKYNFSPVIESIEIKKLYFQLYQCLKWSHMQFSLLTNYKHLLQFHNQYNATLDSLSNLIDNQKEENENNLKLQMIQFCNFVFDLKIKIEIFNRVLFLQNILKDKKLTNKKLIETLFENFPGKSFEISLLEKITKKKFEEPGKIKNDLDAQDENLRNYFLKIQPDKTDFLYMPKRLGHPKDSIWISKKKYLIPFFLFGGFALALYAYHQYKLKSTRETK